MKASTEKVKGVDKTLVKIHESCSSLLKYTWARISRN